MALGARHSVLGTRRRVAAALIGVAALGCEERLSGPEAIELVRALEESFTLTAGDRLAAGALPLAGDLTGLLESFRSDHISIVEVDVGGRLVRYRAIVFERFMVPPRGLIPDGDCPGPRWQLILLREGGPLEGMVLYGGDFSEPIRRDLPGCAFAGGPGPQPVLWGGRLRSAGGEREVWQAPDGEGSISRGEVVGDCEFLEAGIEQDLRNTFGMDCAVTRHRVEFRAHAPHPLGDGRGHGLVTIELPPTEVLGTRYTIHCNPQAPEAGHNCMVP